MVAALCTRRRPALYLSQSRAPKTRPRQTSEAVKEVSCELREILSEQYHRPAGAPLIQHYLPQDEQLKDQDFFIPTSSRTITRILREPGYIQSPKKYERMPLERCPPMEEWEMDFCEIRLEDGTFEFFLMVDRGLRYLQGCDGYRADSAILIVCRRHQRLSLTHSDKRGKTNGSSLSFLGYYVTNTVKGDYPVSLLLVFVFPASPLFPVISANYYRRPPSLHKTSYERSLIASSCITLHGIAASMVLYFANTERLRVGKPKSEDLYNTHPANPAE